MCELTCNIARGGPFLPVSLAACVSPRLSSPLCSGVDSWLKFISNPSLLRFPNNANKTIGYKYSLEAALNVSEYTDKVDILSYTSKSKRIVHQIKDLCAIISGLVGTFHSVYF